ncbi:TetR family transcriptional regulator [Cryptosporangium phraense]|uniref:TetR family transcriptional regulator n=1 Tax=Cryptosporangium phraense TaxID=2593070 RepID=A0A545AFI4_9ACTN|nr:TetR family transcriptional regulator [Cryptosporangium phraense]TQS40083.1 TetR family transcriptional regulator [Cryptosporangium phraense]
MSGLRERKRQRTHDTISATAIRLFLERGFDAVSVADVADAAEVSKPTLFRYFPTKEDLVLHRIGDHLGEPARVVAAAAGDPVAALHKHFLDGLAQRDPVTGLNDVPEVLAFHRLVFETPALAARRAGFIDEDEAALASALEAATGEPELMAKLVAAQVLAVQRVLARENWRRIMTGTSADELYPAAVDAADAAFALLRPDTATARRERAGPSK